jgi:hypothetical protein
MYDASPYKSPSSHTDCNQGHEHGGQGDAHHHKFANDASSVREGIGLSDNSSSGQCIEINARQAGEQPEGLCIEINGARIGGIGGGDGKAQTTVTEIVTLGGAGMGYVNLLGLLCYY